MSRAALLLGIVAILRGIRPDEAVAVGQALVESGVSWLEVPLNSPDPLTSIERLRTSLPEQVVVGAGTVLTPAQVRAAEQAGASMIVSPSFSAPVVAETVRLGLRSCPGVATPTEAFDAIAAGAGTLKVFPAVQVGLEGFRAWTAVLPGDVPLLPVGGIGFDDLEPWLAAGASGFGIGTQIFRPGDSAADVAAATAALVHRWTELTGPD